MIKTTGFKRFNVVGRLGIGSEYVRIPREDGVPLWNSNQIWTLHDNRQELITIDMSRYRQHLGNVRATVYSASSIARHKERADRLYNRRKELINYYTKVFKSRYWGQFHANRSWGG